MFGQKITTAKNETIQPFCQFWLAKHSCNKIPTKYFDEGRIYIKQTGDGCTVYVCRELKYASLIHECIPKNGIISSHFLQIHTESKIKNEKTLLLPRFMTMSLAVVTQLLLG